MHNKILLQKKLPQVNGSEIVINLSKPQTPILPKSIIFIT